MLVVLERLTNSVKAITDKIGSMDASMKAIDVRLADIEREPAEKWKKITWEIIKAVVLAAAGAGIAVVIKG